METIRRLATPLAPIMTMLFLYITVQTPAMAEMISTQSMVNKAQAQQQRQKILKFYERKDVKAALQKQGLSATEAQARVAKLSNAEVQVIANKIDKLPAGAGVESILVIFLILIILELMGVTNIFSFV